MTKIQWITIGLYFALLAICVGLMIIGDALSLKLRDAIIPIATDGFKLVLGATVGAISAIFGSRTQKVD